MSLSPEILARFVQEAVGQLPAPQPGAGMLDLESIPVRPPRRRPLARMLFEGDALRADIRRFLNQRKLDIPDSWTAETILQVEQSLQDMGAPPGSYLGLLRFSCDLSEDQKNAQTWSERRFWGSLRRRLASSSGLLMIRSVADGMEVLRYLAEEADSKERRAFTDLLRVLAARTGVSFLHQTRMAERSLWEFAVLVASRARAWNRVQGSTHRVLVPLDFFWGAMAVFLRDRQQEPTLVELRSSVLQNGATLAPALDGWVRKLQTLSGSSLFPNNHAGSQDPRAWVWTAGKQVTLENSGVSRRAALATCERALIEMARRHEAWKESLALWLDSSLQEQIDRLLPVSRRLPESASQEHSSTGKTTAILPLPPRPGGSSTRLPKVTAPILADAPVLPRPTARQPMVVQAPLPKEAIKAPPPAIDPLVAAMSSYESGARGGTADVTIGRSAFLMDSPSEPLESVGFGLEDLQRQAGLLEEALKTGYTPAARPWIDRYRSLLGDSRVREFLRLPPEWVAGLREVFTVADPWMMCGVEDLLRYIYPQVSRPQHLEFRYKERHGDTTSSRPSYDWVVLRLIAVAVYESLATMDAGAQSTPPLAVVRRWQTLSRASREPSHTPTWWGWLVETVDAHCENVGHTFPLRRPPNPRWREQYMRPQLAIPTADAFAALEAWAHTPLASLLADPTGSERWASRFSMLSQFLDEAKEDALGVLLAKI